MHPKPIYDRFASKAKIIISIHDIDKFENLIGCYGWFLNQYLYIGKSIKVRNRILSHFPIMIRRLGSLVIRDIEFHVWPCNNSLELNSLEGKLIMNYNPKYNKDYGTKIWDPILLKS